MTIKIRDLQNLEQIECVDLTDKEMQLISGGLFNGEKGFKLNGFLALEVVSHGGSGDDRLGNDWG
jgi:bacteriocin-like protein